MSKELSNDELKVLGFDVRDDSLFWNGVWITMNLHIDMWSVAQSIAHAQGISGRPKFQLGTKVVIVSSQQQGFVVEYDFNRDPFDDTSDREDWRYHLKLQDGQQHWFWGEELEAAL